MQVLVKLVIRILYIKQHLVNASASTSSPSNYRGGLETHLLSLRLRNLITCSHLV